MTRASRATSNCTVGAEINVFPRPTREDWEKPYEELEVGDRLVLHNEATVASLFMQRGR